jgi:hypothetical protein
MAIELHHLNTHGMIEQACDVLDGVVRLKERIAELEKLNHDMCERVTENDEIRLHWEEIEQTRAENERMKALIAELKEERRWKKFPDEKPEKGQKVLFRAKYKTDNIRTWIGEFRNVDFDVFYASAPGWGCEFLPNEIFGWMPLPSAPKEEK